MLFLSPNLKVADVDRVEADEGGVQPDVCLGQGLASQIPER